MKVGGFQLPWAAGVYIISFMLPWELTMPAALLPAARSISFFFAGQKLFAISKEIAKTLISELLYARNGNILQKRPATQLKISIRNKCFFWCDSSYTKLLFSYPNYRILNWVNDLRSNRLTWYNAVEVVFMQNMSKVYFPPYSLVEVTAT